MKPLLYLIIWPNGHEEKVYAADLLDLIDSIKYFSQTLGLPDLIYRKE